MLSKTRTTVIALAAALSCAGAAAVPAVSQAAPNTGGYQKSNEGFKMTLQQCEQWGQLFEQLVNEAGKAYEAEGATGENFKNKLGAANLAFKTAQTFGCSWAARVVPLGGMPVAGTVAPAQAVSP
jgi:hypothetical protein